MFKRPNQLPLPSRHRILYVLRSARGAIDLASIMVGVIILGLTSSPRINPGDSQVPRDAGRVVCGVRQGLPVPAGWCRSYIP